MPTTEVFIPVDYRLDFSDNANLLMEKLLQNYPELQEGKTASELSRTTGIIIASKTVFYYLLITKNTDSILRSPCSSFYTEHSNLRINPLRQIVSQNSSWHVVTLKAYGIRP